MALKDLVADHRKINEETIEKVVAPFVRYDPAAHKIIWTPEGRALKNEAKILVFLVALLGWQYVLEEAQEISSKPGYLESELGIQGGTLKRLKDTHLLAETDGHYRVQLANLASVEAAIFGGPTAAKSSGRSRTSTNTKREAKDGTKSAGTRKAKGRLAPGRLGILLTSGANEGFFNKPRTLGSLLERYHEHGVITKLTSLSGLMLQAVQTGVLTRTKVAVDGKQVWAYKSRSS